MDLGTESRLLINFPEPAAFNQAVDFATLNKVATADFELDHAAALPDGDLAEVAHAFDLDEEAARGTSCEVAEQVDGIGMVGFGQIVDEGGVAAQILLFDGREHFRDGIRDPRRLVL